MWITHTHARTHTDKYDIVLGEGWENKNQIIMTIQIIHKRDQNHSYYRKNYLEIQVKESVTQIMFPASPANFFGMHSVDNVLIKLLK